MEDFEKQYEMLANQPTLFPNNVYCPLMLQTDNFMSNELWESIYEEFKWLLNQDGVLQCRTCQNAWETDPMSMDRDGWICMNQFSYRKYDKDAIPLILKIHSFSENHLKAIQILSCSYSNNNFSKAFVTLDSNIISADSILSDNSNGSKAMTPPESHLGMSDLRQKATVLWQRYMNLFQWLYVTGEGNPGCRLCEEASQMSGRMARTKWTDPGGEQSAMSIDRPKRTLLQHNQSTNHRLAEEVLGQNCRLQQIVTEERSADCRNIFPASMLSRRLWVSHTRKYQWLYYEPLSRALHCLFCERAYSEYPLHIKQTPWTDMSARKEAVISKEWIRQTLEQHQNSRNHTKVEGLLRCDYDNLIHNLRLPEPMVEAELSDDDDDDDDKKSLEEVVIEEESFVGDHNIEPSQWLKLRRKYRWLCGQNGRHFGCRSCQRAYSIDPSRVAISNWTRGFIEFGVHSSYLHLRKKLYQHNCCHKHQECVVMATESGIEIDKGLNCTERMGPFESIYTLMGKRSPQ